MEKDIEFKQIILVTDGESNVGYSPVEVAQNANQKGVNVNTIGIVTGNKKEKPLAEIQEIAIAGGGLWELTNIKDFAKTIETVTKKSVYKTIEETVNKELKNLLGTELNDMHPTSRKTIIDIIDKLGDEIGIKTCIVIDCSGSMSNKINIAKKSIINLLRVLKERKGKTEIAVIGYPDGDYNLYRILCDFTEDIVELEKGIQKITTGGTTPTGPALQAAVDLLLGNEEKEFEDINTDESIFKDNIV
ncbi:VWA domain-containing protein [Thermohalobacter berrensis]|uniref:VWFA domain-containing protein n=1 Tax=Thermohalobacter berrensis TaxID=99594 RepID=A0A419T8T6_9FIRM|nr:VWA domain-containing protein [Thermohalobacter berrensis]RKD33885.1 hypothetical protein BET03_08125 [Thermohalobacter berrensis]